MEEVEQHRNQVFVAQVHEILDLEDHERRKAELIGFCIEQVAHGSGPGVVLEALLQALILDHIHKISEAAHTDRAVAQQGHGLVDGVTVPRCDRGSLQFQEGAHPFFGPGQFGGVVYVLQRGKRQRVTASDIIVGAAYGFAEGKHRHALVKGENLGLVIPPELRRDEREKRRFACADGSKDQRVPDISHMQVEPKRRGTVGRAHHEGGRVGRIKRAWAIPLARPDAGEGEQIGQVEGVDKRPAEIGEPVAGMRAQPGIQGVDGLDPAAEAERQDCPAEFPRPILQDDLVLMEQHNAGA